MKIFEKIFNQPALKNNPPILIDIGASGVLYPYWKDIAKYSVCIAFDPDSREMKHLGAESSPYRELYVHNSIVTPGEKTECDFYLTKSPYCSSTLKPNIDSSFAHAPLFEVEKKVTYKAENLKKVLEAKNIHRVDWFKTDSQGTDLALFKSLPEQILRRVLVADLEPGIIDAYEGENKAWEVLQFMEKRNFWLSDIRIMPVRKIPRDREALSETEIETFRAGTGYAPGWAEMSYINDGTDENLGIREFLLLWVFSTIKNQHGFAFDVATSAFEKFNDGIFLELKQNSKGSARKKQTHYARTTKLLRALNYPKKLLRKIL